MVTSTAQQPRSIATGLTDSTHSSSSSSAERYRLDEFDDDPILIYNYHGSLETSSQKDLCHRLDKNEQLRVTKKQIPRATLVLDIKRHDLYLPEEQREYAKWPNYDSSIAGVRVPWNVYWSRLLLGSYDQLYIVSPERTPASSVADCDSRRISPTSTWGADSQELMAASLDRTNDVVHHE